MSAWQVGKRVLCRHPFEESKRAYVMPHKVESMYKRVWDNGKMPDPHPHHHRDQAAGSEVTGDPETGP